jgi:hypothetical protein
MTLSFQIPSDSPLAKGENRIYRKFIVMAYSNAPLIVLCIILYLSGFLISASADPISEQDVINEILRSVSKNNMMDTISDLQENVDVNSPSKSNKSRYCLRVRDASDPTDGACDNAADYIYNKFASYGLDVEYDPFIHTVTSKSDDKTVQESYKMRNVVATLRGKGQHKDMTYIICSHYDSTAGLSAEWLWKWKSLPAPGADDNASGISAVLEAARILSQYSFDFSIKFIAFSGEELGMFGSKHYASNAFSLGYSIAGVLNLDMLGYDPNELDIDVVADEGSEWMANAVNYVRDENHISLGVNRIVNAKMIYSDHSSFWKSGYSAVLVSEGIDSKSGEFSPVNHTAEDTIDKINSELLLRSSKLMIATLARLANPTVDHITELDLAINSVSLSKMPSDPRSMTIKAGIYNLSDKDAMDVNAQIWLIPPETWLPPILLKEITFDIKARSSYDILEPIHLNSWGDYTVIIKINSDFHIFESDFTNNMVRKTISLSEELGIANFLIYPNPVNDKHAGVNIRYNLSRDANVTLNIYDLLGELIHSEVFPSGDNGGKRGPNNNVRWDFKSSNSSSKLIASGVYICQATAVDENGKRQAISGKLVLVR